MLQETELIGKAKNGDVEAFQNLILAYQEKIYSFAFYLAKNQQDASDLSQETWVKVFKQLSSFRLDSSFYTWVCRILRNLFIDHHSRIPHKRPEVSLNDELDSNIPQLGILEQIEQQHRDDVVADAVSRLPDEFRSTIVLVDMQGLSYEEAAKITDVSINTVRSRLSRGRERLRAYFEKAGTF